MTRREWFALAAALTVARPAFVRADTYTGPDRTLGPDFPAVRPELSYDALDAGLHHSDMIALTPGPRGLVCIGGSNARRITDGHLWAIAQRSDTHPALRIINGCQAGQSSGAWANPTKPVWANLDAEISAAGLQPIDIVAASVNAMILTPQNYSLQSAVDHYTDNMLTIGHLLVERFPNLRQILISASITGIYDVTAPYQAPEPYQHAFHLALNGIQAAWNDQQLWPIMNAKHHHWTNGAEPRSWDGRATPAAWMKADGIHLNKTGLRAVGAAHVASLHADPTCAWMFV